MSIYGGPDIITNGLIVYWDAANNKSYISGSSTINDLSGNNYNGTVSNVTFSNNNGGVINLNNILSSNIILSHNVISLHNTNHTVIGAARYNGAVRGRIITSNNNNWLLGHWNGGTENYFPNGSVKLGSTPNDTNWRIYAGTGHIANDLWQLYINGNLIVTNGSGSEGPRGLYIGGGGQYGEVSNSQFSFLQVYNRVLSAIEILQNYNALKGRFGL